LELERDAFDGRGGEVFDGADADLGLEHHEQEAVFIHAGDEHAELLALLIDAVEVGFVDQPGDGLVGHEGAGSQGGHGGEVELLRVPLAGDEKTAFVNDQRGRCVAAFEQLAQLGVEAGDVFLDELGEGSHVMRIAGFPG